MLATGLGDSFGCAGSLIAVYFDGWLHSLIFLTGVRSSKNTTLPLYCSLFSFAPTLIISSVGFEDVQSIAYFNALDSTSDKKGVADTKNIFIDIILILKSTVAPLFAVLIRGGADTPEYLKTVLVFVITAPVMVYFLHKLFFPNLF